MKLDVTVHIKEDKLFRAEVMEKLEQRWVQIEWYCPTSCCKKVQEFEAWHPELGTKCLINNKQCPVCGGLVVARLKGKERTNRIGISGTVGGAK